MLEEEPLEVVKPMIEDLLNDVDQNKQRAAAELLAGVIGGSKHWPVDAQERLWTWLTPKLTKVLTSSVKTDTLLVWTSFLEVFRIYLTSKYYTHKLPNSTYSSREIRDASNLF